jgi:hypothetical protein
MSTFFLTFLYLFFKMLAKWRDFIIDGTIYWVRLFEVSVFERKEFFLLRNIGKIDQTFKSVWAIHGIQPIWVWGTEVWHCSSICISYQSANHLKSIHMVRDNKKQTWFDFWLYHFSILLCPLICRRNQIYYSAKPRCLKLRWVEYHGWLKLIWKSGQFSLYF